MNPETAAYLATLCNECDQPVTEDDAAPACGAHVLHIHCAPWFHCTACYRARTEDVL